jgi:hypothetical protein
MRTSISIQGTTPLLMGAFAEETALNIEKGVQAKSTKGKLPRDIAAQREYRDIVSGLLYIPGTNILACLRDAGSFVKVGKKQVTTVKSSILTGAVRIVECACLLDQQEYEIDSRRIVNPKTGDARICHRPRFDQWSLSFTLLVSERFIPAVILRQIADIAGELIGLGDFRPARKGPFGCFVITSWQEEE